DAHVGACAHGDVGRSTARPRLICRIKGDRTDSARQGHRRSARVGVLQRTHARRAGVVRVLRRDDRAPAQALPGAGGRRAVALPRSRRSGMRNNGRARRTPSSVLTPASYTRMMRVLRVLFVFLIAIVAWAT